VDTGRVSPGTWTGYFAALIGVSAVLLSIAFLTFQVRTEMWHKTPLRHVAAVTTLIELAMPLFFGLLVITPDHPWEVAGAIVGAAGYLVLIWHIYLLIRARKKITDFDKWQIIGLPITGTTFSLLLWYPSLAVKSYVCTWLIFSGATEAWIFLRPPMIANIDAAERDAAEAAATD
jgi:hypothetical protein